jgi:hypothetical protein
MNNEKKKKEKWGKVWDLLQVASKRFAEDQVRGPQKASYIYFLLPHASRQM